jgi:phosphoribosyl-ATP pyrophosphohydrolase
VNGQLRKLSGVHFINGGLPRVICACAGATQQRKNQLQGGLFCSNCQAFRIWTAAAGGRPEGTGMAKPTRKAPPKTRTERGAKKGAVKKKAVRRVARPIAPPLPAGASAAVLDRLWSVVTSRRGADPTVSHSARLLSRGTAKIAQKFGEEAVECLIEATLGDHRALVAESADVLYHLIVMWVDGGVRPEEVWAELRRRESASGVAEKAAWARTLPLGLRVRSVKIP